MSALQLSHFAGKMRVKSKGKIHTHVHTIRHKCDLVTFYLHRCLGAEKQRRHFDQLFEAPPRPQPRPRPNTTAVGPNPKALAGALWCGFNQSHCCCTLNQGPQTTAAVGHPVLTFKEKKGIIHPSANRLLSSTECFDTSCSSSSALDSFFQP